MLNLYKKRGMLKWMSMRIQLLLMIVSTLFVLPVAAQSRKVPYISVSGSPGLTVEAGYEALAHGSFSVGGGLSFGETWGGLIQWGAMYQGASSFSQAWYRYRGFFGLYLGGGPTLDLDALSVNLLAGGVLARYDLSYSYFFFPYIEPGLTRHVLKLGKRLDLELGVSIPLYLRADVFTAGIRATAFLTIKPKPGNAYEQGFTR
jgi:hypothetical protein